MDTKDLITKAKVRFNHQQNRIALQTKYQSQLTMAYNGGLWDITPNLIAFISALQGQVILIDSYEKPVEVDCKEMLELIKPKYDQVMSEWLKEYNEMSKLR